MMDNISSSYGMQDIEEGTHIAIDPPQSQKKNTSASKRGTDLTNEVQSSSSNSNSLENNIDGFNKLEDDFHENSQHQNDNNATTTKHNNPTYKSLISSSVVCFIIYFVFCIVFSSVVWDPLNSSLDTNINPPFGVSQGVGINLMGIAVGSVFFAWKSGCKAIISGPDLLPVVFFAEAGVSVTTYLAATSTRYVDESYSNCLETYGGNSTSAVDDISAAASDYHHRFLGGGPCDNHRNLAGGSDELYLDDSSISKVVPTTLVAMMIGNLVTALLFYGLGKMKNTASVIGFIPASVVAGFLTCIGYKVIKLAVLISTGYSFKHKYIKNLGIDYYHENDPWLPLFLSLLYGCALYYMKRLHLVATEKLILAFIAVPLVLFFITIAITGTSMDYLRETDWFLTQARDGEGCIKDCAFIRTDFWQTLQVAYGGMATNLVAWGAIPRSIPIFIMGAVMTSLDNMLKLTSSEKALGIDLDYNHEMKLGGKATLISSLFAGSPAYGQTKFNVINLSIAGTSESSLPTLLLGGLCLLVFLSGVAGNIINIMPRFLLGGLCVFAGVGFLYENLWEGRKKMNRASFAIVWIIFLVNFIWEFFVLQHLPKEVQPMVPGLLVVFILGLVLSTFEFMFAFMHKAKDPSIRGGDVCCSSAIRSEKHDNQLAVMSGWFQVFKVESFIFFGTANNLYQQLKSHISDQKVSKPKAERAKYLIFDLTEVTGIDSSARDVFYKVHRLLKSEGINLVWAITNPKVITAFGDMGLYDGAEYFISLDLALRHVEDELLRRAHNLSQKWLVHKSVREIFERQVLANVFNISVRAEEKSFSSARLRPWSKSITLSKGDKLCGDDDDNLYLLYDGEVQVKERDGSTFECFTGSFFNLDRVLVSIGALSGIPSTLTAVCRNDCTVLAVSRKSFMSLMKEDTAFSSKLLLTLLSQKEANRPGRIREPSFRKPSDISGDEPPTLAKVTVASRLFADDDYKISLTDAQIERFGQLFDLILEPGETEVSMERFSSYVGMEARVLGSKLEKEQFIQMIEVEDPNIDDDGNGKLSKEEFLSFLRSFFLADIPSVVVDALRLAYDEAVAKSPNEPMDESRIASLFKELGFDTKSSNMGDVIGVIDADDDGDVDFNEYMTGIGMLKKMTLLSNQLDSAFSHYKNQSKAAKMERRATLQRSSAATMSITRSLTSSLSSRFQGGRASVVEEHEAAAHDDGGLERSSSATMSIRRSLASSLSSRFQGRGASAVEEDEAAAQDEGGLELDASDLEAFLGISKDEAEEMVFLADQDEVEVKRIVTALLTGKDVSSSSYRSIDREEFQQLIRNWS